jgi:hypothetical protein
MIAFLELHFGSLVAEKISSQLIFQYPILFAPLPQPSHVTLKVEPDRVREV